MTPGARLAAAIELFAAITASLAQGGAAAGDVMRAYFRGRRYAGSGDRRAIGDFVYEILRARGRLLWAAEEIGLAPSPRGLVLAHLALADAPALHLLGEGGYAPPALGEAEKAALVRLETLDFTAMPAWARWNCPAALAAALESRFGARAEAQRQALLARAPTDLRVNGARATRAAALAAFHRDGIAATPTPFSPHGVRLGESVPLDDHPLLREGLVEVQDEGAQLIALGAAPQAGETVVDLCAGAGGKTLALHALMAGKGRLLACDVDARRLARLAPRLKRAHAQGVEPRLLPEAGAARATALKDLEGDADCVLVDAPCSGTGTWRRAPDARWRYDGAAIARFARLQDALLDEAAALLRPGGRLVFATCSLLPQEGEARIEALLARRPGLALVDPGLSLRRGGVITVPQSASFLNPCLLLSPADHGTDGFFIASLRRQD
ncbi:MAG: RsmB/NOP family class I SAM-dependent RNA methyltransferase [Pseudomonadota bacterium]